MQPLPSGLRSWQYISCSGCIRSFHIPGRFARSMHDSMYLLFWEYCNARGFRKFFRLSWFLWSAMLISILACFSVAGPFPRHYSPRVKLLFLITTDLERSDFFSWCCWLAGFMISSFFCVGHKQGYWIKVKVTGLPRSFLSTRPTSFSQQAILLFLVLVGGLEHIGS